MALYTISTTAELAQKKVSILIYGEPKVGKTSLTRTLPVSDVSKILYVAVDPGQLALRDLAIPTYSVPHGLWNEEALDNLYAYLLKNARQYEWIVFDGLDDIAAEINYANQEAHKDGRKAWEQTNTYMDRWIRRCRDINGPSSLFITHITEKQDDMGRTRFFPTMPGNKLKEELSKYFDIIGCMRLHKAEGGDTARLIQFNAAADPRYLVGDRSGVLEQYEAGNMTALVDKIKKGGMSTNQFSGKPTVDELEALRYKIKSDKSGLTNAAVAKYLESKAVKNPLELSRDQFNELMSMV